MVETRKSIVVDAPPSVVFKALTDESELVQWYPNEAKMDARVGGEYEFKIHWAAKNLTAVANGKILEIIPNKKLSYTLAASYPGSDRHLDDTVVTWTLEELPDGKTRVTIVHVGVDWEGYSHWLGRLANYCLKMKL
jgi:uncharacterized protein YndB with AHSA1/START domain